MREEGGKKRGEREEGKRGEKGKEERGRGERGRERREDLSKPAGRVFDNNYCRYLVTPKMDLMQR